MDAALDRANIRGDVLELGCGTGRWTERLSHRARTVTALDGSAEMLEQARARIPGPNVAFEQVDVVRGWQPSRQYDVVAAFFFLEHVPDSHIDDLVRRLAAALLPGGLVFVAEGRHRDPAAEVEVRELAGLPYRVVERRRTEAEFVALFGRHGMAIDFADTERLFSDLEGRKLA